MLYSKPKRKWIVGVLSFVLVGCFSFFGSNLDHYKASGVTPPKIDCLKSGLYGCDEDPTNKTQDHFIVEKAVPYWIEWMIYFAAGAAVLAIMIGGVMVFFSGANEDLLEKGKSIILFAIIGLLVAMFSFFIVKLIENLSLPGT
jgi:hypothetical protein